MSWLTVIAVSCALPCAAWLIVPAVIDRRARARFQQTAAQAAKARTPDDVAHDVAAVRAANAREADPDSDLATCLNIWPDPPRFIPTQRRTEDTP